jgi:hypothetical protein
VLNDEYKTGYSMVPLELVLNSLKKSNKSNKDIYFLKNNIDNSSRVIATENIRINPEQISNYLLEYGKLIKTDAAYETFRFQIQIENEGKLFWICIPKMLLHDD